MGLKQAVERWFPLFLISGLGLFLELAIIRWVAAEVRLFSYFKNLSLLAAFLGLSIGFASAGKRPGYWRIFVPALVMLVVIALGVGRVISPRALAYPGNADEFIWYTADFAYWQSLLLFLSLLLLFFLLLTAIFIPLGQATGEEMSRQAAIPAYIVNLLASLAGVWLFALTSYFETPPAVWFGLALLGIAVYQYRNRLFNLVTALVYLAVVIGLGFAGAGIYWSPYQRLDLAQWTVEDETGQPLDVGYTLNVQQVFYQVALNLSDQFVADHKAKAPFIEDAALSYNLPYRLVEPGGNVLIVGAGMGNDAAAALRNGAGHVDAVEIDPAILRLGRELHPEQPYSDQRVNAVVDDARSFFEKNTDQYDVVAFGLLDSHALLSGFSTVRLDSFVYTTDSLQQVKKHLAPDGILSVTFALSTPWIEERLGRMMNEVFGSGHVYIHFGNIGTTFIASNTDLTPVVSEFGLMPWQPDPVFDGLSLTTDDWPYLYLRTRTVPAAYWQALLFIGIICIILIVRSFPDALRPNWQFWLLGAAFLLLEFKSVTEFALLFGTTWLVNVLAISGVLLMALGANLIVLRWPGLDRRLIYALLIASLAFSYFFPLDFLNSLPVLARVITSMILLSLPLLFSGIIFSEALRQSKSTAQALGSNLSGSVAGGVLEYGSLIWGIKSLYIIAALAYLGSFIAARFQRD